MKDAQPRDDPPDAAESSELPPLLPDAHTPVDEGQDHPLGGAYESGNIYTRGMREALHAASGVGDARVPAALDPDAPAREVHDVVVRRGPGKTKKVNQWERVRPIAVGGHGKILEYRGPDGSPVAIKVYDRRRLRKMRMAPGISAWEDVQRERRVWAALPPHPNVVRVFEAIADPDSPKMYIVMELLSGGNILARDASSPSPTLDEDTGRVVRPEGSPGSTLSEADVLRRVQGALKGLSHLHACGIVHGDVNPRNLLLTASGDVKVADLSACLQAFRGSDAVDRTTGAPAFTAPEALRGGSWSGYAADIWSLGVTIYLLLFNCVPFWGASVLDVYSAIERPRSGLPRRGLDAPSDGDAEPAEQERGSREKETADESGAVEQAGWSRELLGLVEAMLEPDPAKRPRCEDLLARAALCAS